MFADQNEANALCLCVIKIEGARWGSGAQMGGNMKSIYAISFAPIPRRDSPEHLELLHVSRWPFCSFIFCVFWSPTQHFQYQWLWIQTNSGNWCTKKSRDNSMLLPNQSMFLNFSTTITCTQFVSVWLLQTEIRNQRLKTNHSCYRKWGANIVHSILICDSAEKLIWASSKPIPSSAQKISFAWVCLDSISLMRASRQRMRRIHNSFSHRSGFRAPTCRAL